MPDSLLSRRAAPSAAPKHWNMPRKRRIAVAAGGMVLLLFLVAAGATVLWLRSVARAALPQLDGDARLAGLTAPVTVRRDEHGVPHIEAAAQADLFLAQGYVTAQDRLWQMDASRRAANGDLAAVLGPGMVKNDITQRVLEIRRTAQRIYSHMPSAERTPLDDYARGVNLYIAQCEADNTLPPEFRLLGYRPAPWTGVDSVSVGLMMVETLDLRIATKVARAHIEARLNSPRLIADLYPVGSWRDHPPTGIKPELSAPLPPPAPAKKGDASEDDDENTEARVARDRGADPFASTAPEDAATMELLGQTDCEGCAAGSNNWVVAGAYTASGKSLLANDMHLTLREPDTWYIADLYAPGYHAAGVTLPGLPFVVAGHNEHVAWGYTALYADVADLYIEKLDGKGNYEGRNGHWQPLAMDRETIHVRGSRAVEINVESTDHGPLLNPLLASGDPPLALKWTLFDPSLNALPLYEMNTASNWAEFSSALAQWSWPTQNLVYADDQGHIAYHAIGKVPIRGGGVLFDKPIPQDTNDARTEWGGGACAGICSLYIPYDQMPNSVDPPAGFLATANSRVTSKESPYPLTDDWADPYRIERIYDLIGDRDRLTPQDMLAMQTDIYSEVDQEMGHRFAYAIEHTAGSNGNGDPELRKAAELMRNWNGRLTTDSAAASLVTQTRAALWRMILEPKLGKLAADYHWGEAAFAEEEMVMRAKSAWLPKPYKNWDALLAAAVRKGMENGNAPAEVEHWNYGSWHVVDIEHPLAAYLPFLSRVVGTGPQPQSGDGTTVKQVGRTLGPSQRFTMNWGNIDQSTENIVLGESGNPYSPYFRDQWKDWYGGTTFALPFTAGAVAAQTRHTLRLLP